MVTDLGDFQFVRNAAADLQVTFSALVPSDGSKPYKFTSDDPAWDAAAMLAAAKADAKSAAKAA
jgi:hypothetical protein